MAPDDDSPVAKATTRGSVCNDSLVISSCLVPWAKKPIFMPVIADDKSRLPATYMAQQGMWRDFFAKVPRLTFNEKAVKQGFTLARAKMVDEKKWHRDLTSAEVTEYQDSNVTRFMRLSHNLAETNRKRPHTAWIQTLLHLPVDTDDLENGGDNIENNGGIENDSGDNIEKKPRRQSRRSLVGVRSEQ